MQTLKEMLRQDSVNKKNEAEKNYKLGKIRPWLDGEKMKEFVMLWRKMHIYLTNYGYID